MRQWASCPPRGRNKSRWLWYVPLVSVTPAEQLEPPCRDRTWNHVSAVVATTGSWGRRAGLAQPPRGASVITVLGEAGRPATALWLRAPVVSGPAAEDPGEPSGPKRSSLTLWIVGSARLGEVEQLLYRSPDRPCGDLGHSWGFAPALGMQGPGVLERPIAWCGALVGGLRVLVGM